ncbi:MAG: NUDIX hydrolase [Nitrososphaeria archaeon]
MAWVERLKSRLKTKSESINEDFRYAAVGVLLVDNNIAVETLLIKRALIAGDPWSGQIAFPGGHFRATDVDLLSAMIREVHEEVGVNLRKQGKIVGSLTVVSSNNMPELKVKPYVVVLSGRPKIALSDEEVEDAFWADLRKFRPSKCEVISSLGPQVREGFFYNDYFIWGITYRILVELLPLLEIPIL